MRVFGLVGVGVGALAVAVVGAARGDDPPQAGAKQQAKAFEKEVTVKVGLKYLLYLPEGYEASGEKKWPLVLFLHGAGESGDNVEKVKAHGLPKVIEAGKSFPCIVVSPQSPGMGWRPEVLGALLDEIEANYRVDSDRVYLTGLSMGGFGTWALAASQPGRFAALVPICGGGRTADAEKVKDIPIRVYHGAKDPVVPLRRSEEMVEALEAAGAKDVKITVYPDAAHDSWTQTYDDPALYEWLFQQKRGGQQ